MRAFVVLVVLLCSSASLAFGEALTAQWPVHHGGSDPWRLDWVPPSPSPSPVSRIHWSSAAPAASVAEQSLHPIAIQHSDAYLTRAKIHKLASIATLPLFAAELVLGQSLYNGTGNVDSKRGMHAAVGAGIVGLFAVNTVTGAWNMFGEGRQESEGRRLRLIHGLLMMAADAGFMATWAAAPGGEHRGATTFVDDRALHRNLAVASISLGTAGYLAMLFGRH